MGVYDVKYGVKCGVSVDMSRARKRKMQAVRHTGQANMYLLNVELIIVPTFTLQKYMIKNGYIIKKCPRNDQQTRNDNSFKPIIVFFLLF